MKITAIDTVFVDRYLFVQVHTDAGLIGLGESGAWGFLEASAAAVETFKRYLIGQDPLRIEHHWQYLYRWTHFRGAAIMGALSAIDIALWDIAGKHFGVPAYQLLGGKTRDKARVYYHVFGKTREELVQGCVDGEGAGIHRRRTPDAVHRRPARPALLQDARGQDGGRHRDGAPVPRGSGRRRRPVHRDPPPPDPGRGDRAGARGSRRITRTSTKTRRCPTTSTRWR